MGFDSWTVSNALPGVNQRPIIMVMLVFVPLTTKCVIDTDANSRKVGQRIWGPLGLSIILYFTIMTGALNNRQKT